MDEAERQEFAALLRRTEHARFGGIRKKAYEAARVNPATWDRAVKGLSIKPHSLRAIIANLWPESDGDWRHVSAVGGGTQDAGQYVESSTGRLVESGVTNEDLLREILRSRAESDQIRADVRNLSERVARLEEHRP
jgi:hypothetical protein